MYMCNWKAMELMRDPVEVGKKHGDGFPIG
jgi:hypothetical protein